MAEKYHWSWKAAMDVVEAWLKGGAPGLSESDYERLTGCIADALEKERAAKAVTAYQTFPDHAEWRTPPIAPGPEKQYGADMSNSE
jgi:hypothetical protein